MVIQNSLLVIYYVLLSKLCKGCIRMGHMITMSKLLFWIPFIGIILFLSLYTKWNKYDILMLLSSFPSIYFMIQILEYSYTQPVQLFDFYLKGIAFSTIFYSILVFIIIKKKKQLTCFNDKNIILYFLESAATGSLTEKTT